MLWWLLRKLLGRIAVRQARRWAAAFEEATHHPRAVQDALLTQILHKQRDTRFGREHRFHEIRDLTGFRNNLAIRRYEDFEPYIAAMRKGDLNALVSDTMIHMFALTSGTTATRKYIPVTPQYLYDYRRGFTIWGIRVFDTHKNCLMRPILQLVSDWDEFRTEAGTPCGSVSGLTAQMQKRVVRWLYCMPAITGKIKDMQAKYYTALRLSLPRNLGMITSANPSTLVNLARAMDQQKEWLIRDIHDGTLSAEVDVPQEVRDGIHKKTKKRDPKRARELEEIVRRTGTLTPKTVWPELTMLGNWTGGSVGAYLRHYPRYFGDTPVRDLGLLASEGRMSIPLTDGTPGGVLDITSHFFEFVPQNEIDSPNPTVLRADEVEAGQNYFLLFTTSYGLYRYNIFDLVRVTGFHNATPIIEFLNKGSHFSNLTGEKLSEFQVAQAAQAALRELDLTVNVYTVSPCWSDETPYYGLFVERGDLGATENARDLASRIDRHLRQANIEYDSKRASGRLGPMRAILLAPGALHQWDRQRLSRSGGTGEQYKHPCLYPDHQFRDQMPVEQELEADDAQASRLCAH
jgi:hypothetical protein